MFAIRRFRSVFGSPWINCSRNYTVTSAELQRLKEVLQKSGFSEMQSDTLVTDLEPHLPKDSLTLIRSSLACWRKNITSTKELSEGFEEQFTNVFLEKEPRLLLVKPEHILQRIEELKSLDLVRGRNDLWTLFKKAPTGYYMQEWKEFLRKYYYITYKVLPWLEPKITRDSLNPILQYPPVMEIHFNNIKTRFLFAQRTGYKINTVGKSGKINLNTLLVHPVDEFLKIYSPNCTMEEFRALESINANAIGEEDDKLFEDLVALAPKVNSKSFVDNALKKESYLISDIRQ